MVGSQDNDDHSYDPPLGELFDFEGYCAEDSAQLESASDAGPPAPSGPGLSGRTTSLNPHENQENPTNAAIESLNNQAAFTDDWFDFLGEPSQAAAETGSEPFPRLNPPLGPSNAIAEIQDSRLEGPEELSQSTETGNEPFHQHGQTSTDIPSVAEIQDLDNEIEDIELRLRLKDLRTKRRRLLQNMPPSQQAQSPQRPESRDDRSPSKLSVGGVLVTNQTESFLNTSQDPSKAVSKILGIILDLWFCRCRSSRSRQDQPKRVPITWDNLKMGLLIPYLA